MTRPSGGPVAGLDQVLEIPTHSKRTRHTHKALAQSIPTCHKM
jgi:hypothetical protein